MVKNSSKLDEWALASFILSLTVLMGIGSLLAIIFGFISLRRLKHSSNLSGRPFALSGILLGFIIPFLSILLLGGILAPNFLKARAQGQITSCQSNLKNIATALEMYSTDNKGMFPKKLSQLTPAYLRQIPLCYAAGKDTYSAAYISKDNPSYFKIFCSGNYHSTLKIPQNHPQYDSDTGLNISY